MSLKDCYNIEDFRKLAKKNLPAPIFHYIGPDLIQSWELFSENKIDIPLIERCFN